MKALVIEIVFVFFWGQLGVLVQRLNMSISASMPHEVKNKLHKVKKCINIKTLIMLVIIYKYTI